MTENLADTPIVKTDVAPPSLAVRVWRAIAHFARRSPMSAVWGVIAIAIVLMAVSAPIIAPHDPLKSNFRTMQKPPSAENLFGTDQIGRDTLSRTIHGSRTSLIVAISAVLIGTTGGALWGLASGFLGGRFDIIIAWLDPRIRYQ